MGFNQRNSETNISIALFLVATSLFLILEILDKDYFGVSYSLLSNSNSASVNIANAVENNRLTNDTGGIESNGTLSSKLDEFFNEANKSLSQGNFQEAINWLNRVLEIDKNNVNALNKEGYILDRKLSKPYEAIKLFDRVLDIDMNNTDALNYKGRILDRKLFKPYEAIKLFDRVLDIDMNDTNAMNNKAVAFKNLGKYEEALTWFDKALTVNQNHIGALINKGSLLGILGRHQEAIELFDRALLVDKNNFGAMVNKGAELISLHKYNEAIKWFNKALSINVYSLDARNGLGAALSELGNYTGAIKLFDQVLETNMNYTGAMNNKGVALGRQGHYQEAMKWFDNALRISPPEYSYTSDIVSNKAFVLANNLNQYPQALSLTMKYLGNNPQHKGLLCIAATIYNETGFIGAAIDYEQKVKKLDPNYKCGLIQRIDLEEPLI